ncbi:ATP-binding protein [Methylocella sp.]|uniref:ATP-binding protein n=1 Tax=Methylocella sp. TaxID=1978226 RepID=UPI0037837A47
MNAAADGRPTLLARPRWMSSLRAQLIVGFVAIDIAAAAVCAAVVIVKARRAALVEMKGSMRLAETLVGETIRLNEPRTPPDVLLATLAQQLGFVRHVRFAVYDEAGRAIETRRPLMDELFEREAAPGWFMALVAPNPERSAMPVIARRRKIGAVHIVGAPQDEVAEVWEDTLALASIALLANLAVIATLYFAFGRILKPLTRLADGFGELERGDFSTRIAAPPAREFAEIVDRFNHLAATLGEAYAENRRLGQRLVGLQDEERRRIALDLHDEFGPCFFGLNASLRGLRGALAGIARDDPAALARAAEQVGLVEEIVERMRVANRAMLHSLRPMAMGHVPLAEILLLLARDFSRLNPAVSISLEAEALGPGYGEAVDLTVYRCVQESLTNAVRHSGAAAIRLRVGEEDGAGGRRLRLVVEDEGRGVPVDAQAGFGLRGMKERIEALGGVWSIGAREGGGARLSMTLPVGPGAAPPDGAERKQQP